MPEGIYERLKAFVVKQEAIKDIGIYLGAEHLEEAANKQPPVIVVYPLDMELERGGTINNNGRTEKALASGNKNIAFFCTANSYQGAEQVAGLVIAAFEGAGVKLKKLEYSEADTDGGVRVAILELSVASAFTKNYIYATVQQVIAECACCEKE